MKTDHTSKLDSVGSLCDRFKSPISDSRAHASAVGYRGAEPPDHGAPPTAVLRTSSRDWHGVQRRGCRHRREENARRISAYLYPSGPVPVAPIGAAPVAPKAPVAPLFGGGNSTFLLTLPGAAALVFAEGWLQIWAARDKLRHEEDPGSKSGTVVCSGSCSL